MATITAHLIAIPVTETSKSPTRYKKSPQPLPGLFIPPQGMLSSFLDNADRFIYYPTDADPAPLREIEVGKPPDFIDVYYGKIHINPITRDVGNVATTISYKVEVWNAFFTSKLLTDLNPINAEGIDILNGIAEGGLYGPLQNSIYDIEVTTEGPSDINAEIQWVFGLDYGAHFIEGNRIVLFPFKPASPIIESLSWLTNVLRSYSGEQRIALRKNPRQKWLMRYKHKGAVQARINSALWGRNFKPFGLPIWTDVSYVYSPISAGTTEIYIDTRYFDYRAEGLLVLLYREDLTNETKEIAEVHDDHLVLVRPLEQDFLDGAIVMPVIICIPEGGLVREDIGNGLTVSSINFRAIENASYDTVASDTYLTYEVMGNWNYRVSGGVASAILHPSVTVDNKTIEQFDVFAYRDQPDEMWDWSWMSNSPEERWEVKMFLMRMRGMQKRFWISTRVKDIEITETVPVSSSEWTIKNINQDMLELIGDARHVEILLKNGNIYRREIVGLVTTSEDKQTQIIEVSATIPEIMNPEDVDRISYLRLVRLDSDDAEIIHTFGIQSELTMPIITVEQPTGL